MREAQRRRNLDPARAIGPRLLRRAGNDDPDGREDTPSSANPVNPMVPLAMRVSHGDRLLVEARANAEPAADMIPGDYYTRLPQIRLSVDATGRYERADTATEVILDGTDIDRLVECAIRHPNPHLRRIVAAAIWNEPETFREIFEFGLNAPPAFAEIRDIVAAALAKAAPASQAVPASERNKLLPPMPLPAHLKDRGSGR